ncbi:MAG: hypothetical protein OHK0017_10530 [Patescibacteria group bacterium]
MSLALSSPVEKFFKIPLVIYGIHAAIIGAIILIGYQYWINYKNTTEIQQMLEENKSLASSNNLMKIQKDYFESNIYAEKSAKEGQWRKRGEMAVDTTSIEPTQSNGNTDYIPEEVKKEKTNPEKWMDLIFGE